MRYRKLESLEAHFSSPQYRLGQLKEMIQINTTILIYDENFSESFCFLHNLNPLLPKARKFRCKVHVFYLITKIEQKKLNTISIFVIVLANVEDILPAIPLEVLSQNYVSKIQENRLNFYSIPLFQRKKVDQLH
jgi:hypothetical protein